MPAILNEKKRVCRLHRVWKRILGDDADNDDDCLSVFFIFI